MYNSTVNIKYAYNSTVHTQACEYKNGNNRIFFKFLLHFAISHLMFSSGKFSNSKADHNWVTEKWQKSVFVSVSETIWSADEIKLTEY